MRKVRKRVANDNSIYTYLDVTVKADKSPEVRMFGMPEYEFVPDLDLLEPIVIDEVEWSDDEEEEQEIVYPELTDEAKLDRAKIIARIIKLMHKRKKDDKE